MQHDPAGELLVDRPLGVTRQPGYFGLVREGQRASVSGSDTGLQPRAPLRVGQHATEHLQIFDLALKKKQAGTAEHTIAHRPTPPEFFLMTRER